MEEQLQQSRKGLSWKAKGIAILIIVIIAFGSYFYYWYNQTVELRGQAEQVLADSERLTEVNEAIEQEFSRCQEFITQSEGDFGSFEYCKKFIDWVNNSELKTE